MRLEWDLHELTNFANRLSHSGQFETEMRRATKEIAHALLRMIKKHTPIGDTWQLINGWDKNDLAVHRISTGFEVLLINPTEYATWVNDGHKQRPGRFIPGHLINGRFYYDRNADGGMVLKKPFVKGRFFVEKGIVELNGTTQVQDIIMRHLQLWWERV
jgi:hypothetical protein